MSTVDTSGTQDIDALLAEADSLMNDMDAALGSAVSDEDAVATDDAADSVEPSTNESGESIGDVVDELTTFTESVDPEAVAKCLDPEGQSVAAGEAAKQASGDGPKQAPEEWVKEAKLGDGTDAERLPQIPDTHAEAAKAGNGEALSTAKVRSRPVRLVRRIAHLPVDVLIALDYPFAGLDIEIKSFIGYTGIATLLVAAGTLAASFMKH